MEHCYRFEGTDSCGAENEVQSPIDGNKARGETKPSTHERSKEAGDYSSKALSQQALVLSVGLLGNAC